jgi:hypothetical protein
MSPKQIPDMWEDILPPGYLDVRKSLFLAPLCSCLFSDEQSHQSTKHELCNNFASARYIVKLNQNKANLQYAVSCGLLRNIQ